jgi:hypothetical protein
MEWENLLGVDKQILSSHSLEFTQYTQPAKPAADTIDDPLSLDANSTWNQSFRDQDLRRLIGQDVKRTFPDIPYFRQHDVQSHLLNILFVWSRVNQDLSYRQGMHELLAPILVYVNDNNGDLQFEGYALFKQLMIKMKPLYAINSLLTTTNNTNNSNSSNSSGNRRWDEQSLFQQQEQEQQETELTSRCRQIQSEYLFQIDPELHAHLEAAEIMPQLYGIRWLKLLFGREMQFNHIIPFWTLLFKEFNCVNWDLIDWVAVAILHTHRSKRNYLLLYL